MRLFAAAVLAFVLAGCGADLRPGTPVAIETDGSLECAVVAERIVRMQRDGEAAVFVDASTGAPIRISWPFGFAAWLINGTTFLFASDGTEVVRTGDTVASIRGAPAATGEPFRVCAVGSRTYR